MDQHKTVARLALLLGERLAPLADPRDGYALLDFPNYSNVGDSLIWLGELAYFDRVSGRAPDYVCTTDSFDADALHRQAPAGPIYLSGGGNFGDIWPRFQNFRHKVLKSTRGRRVIQLPQTILFKDKENTAATRALIREHGDFVLMVRDQRSFEFASTEFDCEVVLAPDMAFCIETIAAPPPVRDLTYLVRTDQEAASERGEVRSPDGTTSLVTDWLLEQQPSLANRIAGAARRRLDFRSVEARYRAQANAECQRGVELLGRGRAIVTDRLHGHILSLLLDRPHVVVDNSYGKIGGVLDAWTGADPLVHRADDFHEARKIAARLVQA